jgi:phosphopantothenoylcysteine decarboxylase/phosphopantothenate--cysteine ligase
MYNAQSGEWTNHVSLALWADVLVIAPATANTLAKMAIGLCDNLLTSVYLSSICRTYVAPAMDRDMYQHQATQSNIRTLSDRGVIIIEPGEGELASGLEGIGRMAEPEIIFKAITTAI